MPWCPNCKTEYREGIEKCADCGSTLVSSLNEEERAEESCSLLFGDEKHVRLIEKHLLESGISSAFATRRKSAKGENGAEAGKQFELFVAAAEREEAVKCAAEFMRNTNPQAEEAIQNPDSPRVVRPKSEPVQEFKTAKEKKSELKSSGIMLLCFGVAGITFMILVILGVVPMNFVGFNAIIAYSVMSIFFGALLISGIMSLVSAKRLGSENEEEDKLMKEVDEWCDENLTKEIIVSKIPGEDSDEQLYFERFDYMKEALSNKFTGVGEEFLEYYTEKLYSKYFE